MKLSELIEQLEELAEESDGDPEVLVAHQPSWPLQESLVRATFLESEDEECDGCGRTVGACAAGHGCEEPCELEEADKVLYLVAYGEPRLDGRSAPYAPRSLFEGC